MNARVYSILIVLAFLSLAIIPFTFHAPNEKSSPKSQFLGRAANAREVIKQLEATDE